MKENLKKLFLDSTDDYKDNYSKIDWSDGPKVEEKVEEKNPNDMSHIWGAKIRKYFRK
jgi:hypothetical protein